MGAGTPREAIAALQRQMEKSLAKNLDATMRRIRFTPDLLQLDITGGEVLHQENGKNVFRFNTERDTAGQIRHLLGRGR